MVLVEVTVLVQVQVTVLVQVLVTVVQATNQHHMVLDSLLVEVPVMAYKALKCNNMLLMLKVSSLITTHKSSVVQLLVVYKHTHKTSKLNFFNHHLYHPQA